MEISKDQEETLEKSSSHSAVEEDEELRALLLPKLEDLPPIPLSAVESNFVRYYAVDFLKPGHDQFVYRHANGLCVVGLAPTHLALREEGGVTSVDFNVGKSDRSELRVTGKRKRNAQLFQPNSALCNASANGKSYTVRCCVKGSLLEVNDRLIKHPELLNLSADREGYIAIIMPKPTDWLKIKDSFLSYEDYKKLRRRSMMQYDETGHELVDEQGEEEFLVGIVEEGEEADGREGDGKGGNRPKKLRLSKEQS